MGPIQITVAGQSDLAESYATAEVTQGCLRQVHRHVRRVRPSHALLHNDSIALVNITASEDRHWEPVAPPIPLAPPCNASQTAMTIDTSTAPWGARMRHRGTSPNTTQVACSAASKPTRPAGDTAFAATCTGAIADTHPDHQLAALHTAARDGTRVTLGDDACQYQFGIQHLTRAYAYAKADSDGAQRLLRRVQPSHAPLHINAMSLVDVTAAPQAKTITWERATQVPLGTAL